MDLINRQAAVRAAIEAIDDDWDTTLIGKREAAIRSAIDKLPSAHTLITTEAAIAYLINTGWMQAHDRILTDSASDIVRCKDCELRNGIGCPLQVYIPEDSDMYCAWAKRKKDE